jgi:hypothetical protein
MTVSPTAGVNRGTVTLTFSTGALPQGSYSATVTIRATTAVTVTVNLTVGAAAAQQPPPPPPPAPTLTGLAVNGPSSVTVGQTAQYTVTTSYSDGTQGTLTSGPSWSTSSSATGTITQTGLFSAVSAGTVAVQAAYAGLTAQTSVSTVSNTTSAPSTIYVSPSGSDSNSGTQASPLQTLTRALALADISINNGVDTRVYASAGVYREAIILTAPTNTSTTAALQIEGAAGTVLSGADLWNSGWTSIGNNTWTHAWPYKWGAKPIPSGWEYYWNNDGLGYIRNRMLRSEMLFVNDQPFQNRLSSGELVPGTFYVDESNSRLTVMLLSGQTAPITNYQVEVAVRFPVLRIENRKNVTVKGFQIEKGRGALQDVMASAINSSNIVLDTITVRHAGSTGWSSTYNQGLTIRNSQFVDNGVVGLNAQRDKNNLLENSIIARNNFRGWAAEVKGYDAVFKWGGMRDATVRYTQFVDNWGNGFWLDYDNQRVTADHILSGRNTGSGVSLEMNPGPVTISNSKFCLNNTGVEDARSNSVTLSNNQIFNNTDTQLIFSGSGTPVNVPDWETGVLNNTASINHVYTGNVFFSNAPTANTGVAGWLLWGPFGTIYTSYFRPTIRSDNNTWYHSGRTSAFALDNLDGTINFWTGDYNLLKSTTHWNNSSNPYSPTNELNGRWADPGPLSCSM